MIFPNPHRIHGTRAYHGCKWCKGAGCLQCSVEEEKAYKAAFPDGPKPLASIKHDGTPEGIAAVFRGLLGGLEEEASAKADEAMPEVHHILSQLGKSDQEIKDALTHLAAVQIIGDRAMKMEAEQQ